MTAQSCLAAAVELAREIPAEEKIVWPADWPAPELVACAAAKLCASYESALSLGFVRGKPMKAAPAKSPAPSVG